MRNAKSVVGADLDGDGRVDVLSLSPLWVDDFEPHARIRREVYLAAYAAGGVVLLWTLVAVLADLFREVHKPVDRFVWDEPRSVVEAAVSTPSVPKADCSK